MSIPTHRTNSEPVADLTELTTGSPTGIPGQRATPPVAETIALGRSVAFENDFVRLNVDDVRFPDGTEGDYTTVQSGTGFGGIVIARHVRRGVAYYALVEQFRYPARATTLEFPRGGTNDLGSAEALRELVEETGATVDSCHWIGELNPDTSILTSRVGVWLAIVLEDVDVHREGETGLVSRWVTGGELRGLISKGRIRCGMTLAAYALLVSSTGNQIAS